MARDISEWLEGLGLDKYTAIFAENDIGFDVLPDLTQELLKDLGVASLGDRVRLLKAIETLDTNASGAVAETEILVPSQPVEAERRQLTVMFCDLVGSTALSQQLDPEDLRDVMRRYQDAVAGAVARYEGHVAKFLGDGVLAYFGWPKAYEDQAERAIRAGLNALEAVAGVTGEDGTSLGARVGIASGLVVVGDIIGDAASDAEAVTGETPNLAARLQGVAEPGQLVIGPTTRQLIGTTFVLDELGAQNLKGFSEGIPAWRVVSEGTAESRFEAAHGSGLSHLVGREHELGLLSERWCLAKAGEGQMVLLSGEAGIGKSRLVQALRAEIGTAPHFRLRYQCSSHHTNSAFYPLIQRLERAAGFAAADSADVKLDKLEDLLRPSTDDLATIAPLFAALLSLPGDERYGVLELTPQQRRERTIEALIGQVLSLSRQRPVLFVVEDAHWIDPSMEDLIGEIMARIADQAVLMLITYRPEYVPPWVGHPHLATIALSRLGREQGAEIVQSMGGPELASSVVESIVARAGGVPLYIEELTKSVLEAGASVNELLADELIPETLQALLVARIDRLNEAKKFAQVGAVIGREFPYNLMVAVTDEAEDEVVTALDRLVQSELVFRRGTLPDATYSFKQELVQDAAYNSLLRGRRRHLHGRIADCLAQNLPEVSGVPPEVLAHHFTEAEDLERAAKSWFEAGRQAQYRSATHEAIAHYSQAIELIGKLSDRDAHAALELDCYLGLGPLVMRAGGPRDPKLSGYYARAAELGDIIGDDRKSYTVKWGKWYVEHFGAGDFEAATRTADELVELGLRENDRGMLLQAHHAGWTSGLGLNLRTTVEHVENGIKLYVADEDKHQIATYGGHDTGACCRWVGGMAYSIVGQLDRGAELAAEAVTTAQNVEHEVSEVIARSFGASVHFLRRDEEKLAAWVEAMEAKLGDRMAAFWHYVTTPRMLKGWAQVKSGLIGEGLELMESNLAEIRKSGFPRLGFQLHVLADAKRSVGDDGQALEALAEAFEICATTGERLWLPELHRIKGEILLDGKDKAIEAAEHELNQALTIARKQGAMLFELRAARSLARLWGHQDRQAAAHDLLRPVYDRFTEGLDTPDLVEVKALLEQLN